MPKISDLPTDTAPASDDLIVMVDTDQARTESVTVANLAASAAFSGQYEALESVDVSGVLLDDFEGVGAWTASGSGAVAAVTTDPKFGTCMKITGTVSAQVTATADLTCDLSAGFLSFWVKVLDANFSSFAYGVSMLDHTFTSRYETTLRTSSDFAVTVGTWQRISIPMAAATAGGTAVPAHLSDVRAFRFALNSNGSGNAEILVADLRWHRNATAPGVIVMFDDGYSPAYTEAFPAMSALGQVGSVGIIGAQVGDAGKATLAQLQEMQAAGWEHVCHGPTGLSGAPVSSIRTHLRASYDYMVDNSLAEGRSFYVYVGGAYDANVLQEVGRVFDYARVAGSQTFVNPQVDTRLMLKPWYFTKTVTLATAKAGIDRIVARGGLAILTFHDLVASVSATEDWPISDFEELMAYIDAQGLVTYKPSQVFPPTRNP